MSDKTLKTAHNKKRFGAIAVEQGMITRDQLFEALKAQVEDNIEKGTHRLIGEILYQQGAITLAQISEVLMALGVIEGVLGQRR
jgi:hypothetical protein